MEKAFDNPGFIQLLLNFYGYYVPFILLAVWAPLALYDLARRQDVEGKTGAIWVGAIVALPLVGAGHCFNPLFWYQVIPSMSLDNQFSVGGASRFHSSKTPPVEQSDKDKRSLPRAHSIPSAQIL